MDKEQLLVEAKKEQELAQGDNISFPERIPHFYKAYELYREGRNAKLSFEMLGMYYLSKVAADPPENKNDNFVKCVEAFKQSGNKNQYRIMKAEYLFFVAGKEKESSKKAKLYKQAAYELSKVTETKPEEIAEYGDYYKKAQDDFHRAMANYYEASIDMITKEGYKKKEKVSELFKKCAEEYKLANDEKKFNIFMGLHYFYSLTLSPGPPSPDCLLTLKKACEHVEKADNPDFLSKVKAIYLRTAAFFQIDTTARIKYLEEAIKEIEKTSDKILLNELYGSIEEVKARGTADPKEKSKLFLKSADFYRKEKDLLERANINEALSKLILANIQETPLEEKITLYKAAIRILKQTKAKRLYYKSFGELLLIQAMKHGFVNNKAKKCVDLQLKASKAFEKGGYVLEGNLYSGMAFMIISVHLLFPKNIEALEIAAKNLMLTGHIELYDLACHKLFQILIENETDKNKKHNLKKNSLLHLEAYISVQDRVPPTKAIKELLGFDPEFINSLFKAECYKLKGELEDDIENRQKMDREALALFDKVISEGDPKNKEIAYRGKGWLLRDREQFDVSLKVLKQSVKDFPKSIILKKELEVGENLLIEDYRKQKEKIKEVQNLKLDYQNQLLTQESLKRKEVDVSTTEVADNFEILMLKSLVEAGNSLEEMRNTYKNDGEEKLRDTILLQLKRIPQIGEAATRESKHGEGRTDIYVVKLDNKEKAISECLVWNGEEYYKSKKKQLLDNLTDKEKYAFLITFFKDKDFASAITKTHECVKQLDDFEKESLMILEMDIGASGKIFSSVHSTRWGTKLRIYHLLFCLA